MRTVNVVYPHLHDIPTTSSHEDRSGEVLQSTDDETPDDVCFGGVTPAIRRCEGGLDHQPTGTGDIAVGNYSDQSEEGIYRKGKQNAGQQ